MLAPNLSLFDRSRHYGLPTKPRKVADGWGVNLARLDLRQPGSAD